MNISVNMPDKTTETKWRSGMQPMMPIHAPANRPNGYDIFPYHNLPQGQISQGYKGLAEWISQQKFVAIDGYAGIFWNDVKAGLEEHFEKLDFSVTWLNTANYFKPASVIQELVDPFIGEPGGVWGTRTTLILADLFNVETLTVSNSTNLTIVYGVGAGLFAPAAQLVYLDLPKNELQLRMRAKAITNLGATDTDVPAEMYKRFYFVDWVLLNNHKKENLNRMAIIGDAQWKDDLTWMQAAHLKLALKTLGSTAFRVRPWFEPGAWGGQWMKERIAGLNPDEVNYAWSFELIVPENGLVFQSDNNLLEVSFDMLMFAQRDAVLGKSADRFGDDFPIRFDFLDTVRGGNLSIQCHPSLKYIQENFGETITQDETYYILDCEDNATVYLGFQDNIDAPEFKQALEDSRDNGIELNITDFVQAHTAKKHDLYLIPNGTVHSAGAGNLVLEISATPYIFTFKMYDWLRLDLNGEPRAINIDHAFNNLQFERKGQRVIDELISKQSSIKQGKDWKIIHVPTHADHFYDVERVEFDSTVTLPTNNSVQVMMLVEGTSVTLNVGNAEPVTYYYAETFVVPAAAQSFTLTNNGTARAKVIKSFIKE